MKCFLFAFLTVLFVQQATAQSDNFFADISPRPGFSLTYNHPVTKGIGLGIGFQGYNLFLSDSNSRVFMPALIADLRFYRQRKRMHQFFYLIDLGMNFYHFETEHTAYRIISGKNYGVFFGGGIGYFRAVTKRGNGPYASLKFISNSSSYDDYYIPTDKHTKVYNMDGTLVISVGFRFQ